jgi:uncharacterized membrane protein
LLKALFIKELAMKYRKTAASAAIAAVLGLALTPVVTLAATPAMETCYGINKAHKNDCATGHNACAGQATQARDPYAFVLVPKGACEKIAGGSVKPESK